MADLHFVDFALIPSPVRKEKQFRLPDDFSEFDFTDSLTDEPFRVRFSQLFRVLTSRVDRCSAIRTWNVLHEEDEARNLNISALRGRNRHLLAAVM